MNASELILNADGSVFHLHLKPGQVADNVLLVGDPARVDQVAAHFQTREFDVANREFRTVTGSVGGRRITVCSTGIGTDNVDIVINELDAVVNVDFATRTVREQRTSLNILRLGTCGAVQPDQKIGDLILTTSSVGMDCLLDFYADSPQVRNKELEEAFFNEFGRKTCCVDATLDLSEPEILRFAQDDASRHSSLLTHNSSLYKGITVAAPGFYAPQGRELRLRTALPDFVERLAAFRHDGVPVRNIEMESSAVLGLGRLLGHRAGCLCTVIAQRAAGAANASYATFVERLIELGVRS